MELNTVYILHLQKSSFRGWAWLQNLKIFVINMSLHINRAALANHKPSCSDLGGKKAEMCVLLLC